MFVLSRTVFALVMVNTSVTEGGSLKAAADAQESQDSPLGDRRNVIRDARELVIFGHKHLSKPASRDFFTKEDHGVYRLFFNLFL